MRATRPMRAVPRGRFVAVDEGRRLFVRSAGRVEGGTPTLLLHGLGATSALNWAGCFAPLGRRGPVVALDHRGHGRGTRVGNKFRLEDCADDAAALLRWFGAGPAVVVGYSMGGPIAQLLARRHPELVTGLILSATARDFRGRPSERLRFAALGAMTAAAAFGPAAAAPNVVPLLPGRFQPAGWALAELRRHEPAAVLSAAAALGRFSSREWVGELDLPATVLVHSRDRLVPPHRQQKLVASLADAEVIEIDADHLGVARRIDLYLPALLAARASVLRRAGAGTAGVPDEAPKVGWSA